MHFENDWDNLLENELKKEYMIKLFDFLDNEYKTQTIYPPKDEIFNALKLTSYQNTKIVIIGQDPYHQPNQGHGLAFSVNDGIRIPPSLRNIYKEIENTLCIKCPPSGNLTRWSNQGILLLNAVLTVRDSQPKSHSLKGWEQFTDYIISLLNKRDEPVIFMLWGADAKKKTRLINNKQHIILTAAHPSPLSAYRGFFGCDHFKKANIALKELSKKEIEW